MSTHITVNLSGLNNILSSDRLSRAHYMLANQAMADMDQFVPYKRGTLSGSAHIDDNNNIVYNTPYARAQFYGIVGCKYPVVHYTRTEHPQATRRWDLKAKSLYGDKWANKVKQALLGGK
ncbi:MAG: minor capsid protein [Limosilactobacillus oris]